MMIREEAERAHAKASRYDESHPNPKSASEADQSNRLWAEARRLMDAADGIVDPTTIADGANGATVPSVASQSPDKANVNALNNVPVIEDQQEGVQWEMPTSEEREALDSETAFNMMNAGLLDQPLGSTRRERRARAQAQEEKAHGN